jgi:hypothetical protein
MCGEVETSREHAPPRCFFPKGAEVGRNLRVNLITVPACDRHNSEKSNDDEFFRAVVVGISAHASPLASGHFRDKLLRAAQRNPTTYGSYFNEKGHVLNGTFRLLQIDRERLDSCIDRVTRALYFHSFGRKWIYPITPISPNVFESVQNDAPEAHERYDHVISLAREFLSGTPVEGFNPDVFKYRLRQDEERGVYVFAAIFYDVFEVYCYSSKDHIAVAI